MENLKIRVNSEVENKEVQGVFKILGGAWSEHVKADHYDKEFLYLTNGVIEYDDLLSEFLSIDECEEITLPELRDLVVLKRNDVGDASHISKDGTCKYYLSSDRELYFYLDNNEWYATNTKCDDLKPIEKKEMKEYLDKQQDGTYKLIEADSGCVDRDWIEIPEGSETFNYYDRKDNLFFLKGTGDNALFSNDINDWEWKEWCYIDFDGVVCLWSRHTHPEELPFIDDETSLNDQYAEIETVRQSAWQKQEGGSHYKNLKIQPMQYALENKLDYAQANVVKYVTRHKEKNGKEDLLKAIHNIELMIEFYYGDEK